MFDTEAPALIQLNVDAAGAAAAFFERHGAQSTPVLDTESRIVETQTLAVLHTRWWSADGPPVASHFGHWPLGARAHEAPLEPLFVAAARLLAAADTPLACLLDRQTHPLVPRYQWAILGPTGASARIHRDVFGTASWNILLHGRKTWRFWPPGTSTDLQPSHGFEQGPGELVWFPESWWHTVDYRTPCLCVTKNLLLERSLDAVRAAIADPHQPLALVIDAMKLVAQRFDTRSPQPQDRTNLAPSHCPPNPTGAK